MIEAILSLIRLHTPVAIRQSVRAALLTPTTWFASLLLAIATTADGFRGHVNGGGGSRSSDSALDGESYYRRQIWRWCGEGGELDGSDVSPECVQS